MKTSGTRSSFKQSGGDLVDLGRMRAVIEHLKAREAYLVSDQCIELLLEDGRRIRVTAKLDILGEDPRQRYSASHEIAIAVPHDEHHTITAWASIDLPWAYGETIDDCFASAISLMAG